MAIAFNDNFKISAPKPVDKRYLNNSNLPYASIAEVNSIILSSERYIGLTVNIGNVEYWYETAISDGDLLVKTVKDIYVSGATYSGSTLLLHRTQGLSDINVNIGVSGVTDGVVSGATLVGSNLILSRTIGLPDIIADLSALSGGSGTPKETFVTTGININIPTTTTDKIYIASGTTGYTLSSSPLIGNEVTFIDGVGTAGTTNITINGNGNNILNDISALINTDYGSFTIVYNGVFWSVTSQVP